MGGRISIDYEGDVEYVLKNFVKEFYNNDEYKKDLNVEYLIRLFKKHGISFNKELLIQRIENEIGIERRRIENEKKLKNYQQKLERIRILFDYKDRSPFNRSFFTMHLEVVQPHLFWHNLPI